MDEAGVYTITCLPTGKVYVGSTVRRFCQRWGNHRSTLRKGVHHSIHLQRSWNKHGEAAFEFKPLLICRPEDALLYEQRAIDVLKPKLNISLTAGNTAGIKHSEEHRQKCRERMQREWDEGHRADSLRAFHKTPGSREKLSEVKRKAWAEGRYALRKRRRSHGVKHDVLGEMLTVRDISNRFGLKMGTIQYRLRNGASGKDLVAPVGERP